MRRQQQQEETKNETVQKLLKQKPQSGIQVKETHSRGSSRSEVNMANVAKSYVAKNEKGVPIIRLVDNARLGSFIVIPKDVENVKDFLFNYNK